jgi:stage V sporulation protein B
MKREELPPYLEDGLTPLATDGLDAEPAAPSAPVTTAGPGAEHGQFARKVAGVFSTQITLFAIALTNSILVARILGLENTGIYTAVVTLPTMLSSFGTLGLPSAVNYFTGKGMSLGSLVRAAYLLTAAVSAVLVGIVWMVLPALEGSILSAARGHDDYLRAIVLVVPLGILSAFGGAILYGRQAVRVYSVIQIVAASFLLGWVAIVVGLNHGGVRGAVIGSIATSSLTVVMVMVAVHRLVRADRRGAAQPVSYRGLASYGMRSYPASLSGYFSYRADNYILQAVLGTASKGPLALYSRAVTMDELVFYVPNSITTLFLPRVAGSTPEDANRMVARIGRLTTLLTVCVALMLIPVAFVGIHVVLPHFTGALPAFVALLPGMITLSIGKVMTSYLAGRGRPGLVAFGTTFSLVFNIGLNFILIPMYGIVGASLASVFSYSLQAGVAVFFASRMSGHSPIALILPGPEEVRLLVTTLLRLLRGLPVIGRRLSSTGVR